MEFFSFENFDLAYKRIKNMQKSFYKDMYIEDFLAFELEYVKNINAILKLLEEDVYEPSEVNIFYSPKKNGLSRKFTLLNLIDLIIYQAILNIIVDQVYNQIEVNFNTQCFGNIMIKTDDENNQFITKKWKYQWNNFDKQCKIYFSRGYKYVVKLDVASFYDTINHSILRQILEEYEVEGHLIELLLLLLKEFSKNNNDFFVSKTDIAIPQGPDTSSVLSEIFLSKLDYFIMEKLSVKNFRYIRYSDDIIIFSKNKKVAKLMLAYTEFAIKSLGLNIQMDKFSFEEELNNKNIKTKEFSNITKEYKKNYKIKSKQHKKLKKKLIESINNDINKTIIKFSLYKLNKDDEIKSILISNIENMDNFIEPIIYYLNKYYKEDLEVIEILENYLNEEQVYNYNKAYIYLNFSGLRYKNIKFNNEQLINNQDERNWLKILGIVKWISKIGKFDKINRLTFENYYLVRESILNESSDFYLKKYLENENSMLALNAYYKFNGKAELQFNDNYNSFIKNIIKDEISIKDLVNEEFYSIFNMYIPNEIIQDMTKEKMKQLIEQLKFHKDIKNTSTSIQALSNIILMILEIVVKTKLGKTNLNNEADYINSLKPEYLISYNIFYRFYKTRNTKTTAHIYGADKKSVSEVMNVEEYKKMLKNWNIRNGFKQLFNSY
ncbi:RNA-directed DNA polymerase [Miniphocaeibacter massiliensis]|uniref:RNA-directed DNA polymerase n=1 Tax=Miniphocaeibacter massiliensis TaxID=2041841 RepID=UPI000C1C2FB8|nr:RNA-directed DNA polymerase [Miniphocaeibacter massiliensis]